MAPDEMPWGLMLSLAMFGLNGFAWLTRRRKAKGISGEVRRLRREAEVLSQPEDFVKRAKLQRQANAKEKELDIAWKDVQGYSLTLLPRLVRNLKFVVAAVGVVCVWGLPVVRLPFAVPTPTFRFPHRYPFHGAECVAIIPWLVLIDRASRAIWESFFPISMGKIEISRKFE